MLQKYLSKNNKSFRLSAFLLADSFFCCVVNNDNVIQDVFRVQIGKDLPINDFLDFADSFLSRSISSKTRFFQLQTSHNTTDLKQRQLVSKALSHQKFICNFHVPEKCSSHVDNHFVNIVADYYKSIQSIFFIHFDAALFHVFVKKQDEIIFFNSFHFNSDKDVIFYLSSIFENFDLESAHNQQIRVSGNIEQDSKLFNNLSAYFPGMTLEGPKSGSTMDHPDRPHLFFDHILNLACV
jgi:hypothetical protein